MSDDILDSVVNTERRYYDTGYAKGYKVGSTKGFIEGNAFGIRQGALMAREIESINSFSKVLLSNKTVTTNPKKEKCLKDLTVLCSDFRYVNDDDITVRFDLVKAKHKQLLALLNINVKINQDLSF